jgi:hypothetical protein
VTWLGERVYHEREAELKARVDRRRVRIVHAAELETGIVLEAVLDFPAALAELERSGPEQGIRIDAECVVPEVSVAEEVGT